MGGPSPDASAAGGFTPARHQNLVVTQAGDASTGVAGRTYPAVTRSKSIRNAQPRLPERSAPIPSGGVPPHICRGLLAGRDRLATVRRSGCRDRFRQASPRGAEDSSGPGTPSRSEKGHLDRKDRVRHRPAWHPLRVIRNHTRPRALAAISFASLARSSSSANDRTVTFTKEQIAAYAEASGDRNPIHLDDDFARSVGLPGVIAHGMLQMGIAATVAAQASRWKHPPAPPSLPLRRHGGAGRHRHLQRGAGRRGGCAWRRLRRAPRLRGGRPAST